MGQSKKKPLKVGKPPPITQKQKAKEKALKQLAAIRDQGLEQEPFVPYGILNWDQVKTLKDRVRELEVYVRNSVRNMEFLEGDFYAYDVVLFGQFPREFRAVFYQSRNFAGQCGVDDGARLSKKLKQEVVSSLRGYIVQEEFDSIRARLHPEQQKCFLATLLQMFVNKVAIETFFCNPFWYIDENAQPEDNNEELVWDGPTPLGVHLNTLFSRLRQVNDEYSQIWRTITARLCNSTEDQTKNVTFGNATKAVRDAKCTALASHLLANKAFACLLKKSVDREKIRIHLEYAFKHMAQSAVDMNMQVPCLAFRTLEDIDERFSSKSDIMGAEGRSFAFDENEEPRLEGHRVLGIVYPYVYRTINDPEHEEEIVSVSKADVLLEEKGEDVDKLGKGAKSKKPKA
ncbi:hypothetical protein BJX99DRAFT_251543 [Aspergillus californicus]